MNGKYPERAQRHILPLNDHHQPIYVDLAGLDCCESHYRIVRRPAMITVIGYVLSGTGHIHLDDHFLQVREGDAFILPQGMHHDYYPATGTSWSFLWVNISGELLLHLLDCYLLKRFGVFSCQPVEGLLRQALQLASKQRTTHADPGKRMAALIFAIVLELAEQRRKKETTLSPEVYRMKLYLDQHVEERIDLKELCAIGAMTMRNVTRLFQKELHTTPYRYVLTRKIELAKNLIVNTNLSITEIADRLKFLNQYHFSAAFKKRTGLAPLHYRNRQRAL